jgi:hypothetical protein
LVNAIVDPSVRIWSIHHDVQLTLLPLKVLMPWALGFFTYSSIKEHFTSITGLEGNNSYKCQSLQLRNNGFWVWGGLATANHSKISISQFWTKSTFHMARALLTETMLTLVSKSSWNYASKLHFITLFDNSRNLDYPQTFKD